jgi:hypothetical protein
MKYLFSILFILTSVNLVFAQDLTFEIDGRIVSSEDGTGIPGATVLFINVKDSARSRFSATDESGHFKVNQLEQAFYRLSITSMGFKPYTRILRITTSANLGNISLEQDEKMLDEIEVHGDVPMEKKGDTILYNADAYKVNPDASATDLVSKMPGIVVDNNGVSANGEKVEQVLMDGKRFFGQDPLLSLNTIPAEVVNKVEVFDQMSERAQFTGFDDGNTTKTMNVVTKEDKRNGLFGKIYGGYGTDDRYSAGLNLNSFKDDRQLTILGMSNNVNQLNFANEDIVGVSGAGGSRRGFRGGGPGGRTPGANNFLTSNQEGITTTNSAGLNFSDNIGQGATIEGSYFFNTSHNTNDQYTDRETFRETGSQFYNEVQNTSTDNLNHRLNLRVKYDLNDKNQLVYIPSLSYQDNRSLNYTLGRNTNSLGEIVNQTENNYESTNQGYNLNNYLLFQHKFDKIGRSISFGLNSRITNTDRENFYEEFMADSLTEYLTDEKNQSLQLSATYAEPVGLNGDLSASYRVSFNDRISDKETYLLDSETDEREFSPQLSNEFNSGYTTQEPSITYSNRGFGRFFNVGISYQNATLDNEQFYPEAGTIKKEFNSILPTAMGRFELRGGGNLFFRYSTSTNEPSVNQLQNVIDNSNPLFFSLGNPDLNQSYSHSLMMRLNKVYTDKNTSIANFTRVQATTDYITNATEFAEKDSVYTGGIVVQEGTQLSIPINLNGYWNVNNNTTYSKMISKIKSNLNTSLGLGYTRRPGRTEEVTNISNTYSVNMRLGLSSNISENIDFNTYYNVSANTVSNSIDSKANSNSQYITQTIGGKLNLIFWKGIVLRSDTYYEKYNGISDDFNSEYILWNVSAAKKFLKNDLGELELIAFDILNQNQSFSQSVTPNYIEEVKTQVLRQYFMLRFTYQLRMFKTKS